MRQIEALKLQLQQAEGGVQTQQSSGPSHQEEEEYSEYEEIVEEVDVEEEVEPPKEAQPSPSKAPASAAASAPRTSDNNGVAPAGHVAYKKEMESLKQKYAFEKPGWAAPAEVIEKDDAIDCDSINNPLLKKAQHGGYVRQVHEKDIALVKGTHVKPTAAKIEPRLTWIVINVNKRKVGKIVMHLYGKDVHRLVDQFLELKGHEVERRNGMLAIVGQEPTLFVTGGGTGGLDGKSGVYGVIQEGRDIFDTVLAADANAAISVKQAHIYPVKKGRSG